MTDEEMVKTAQGMLRTGMVTTVQLIPLVRHYYSDFKGVDGTPVDIIFADGNVDEGAIAWCLSKCGTNEDKPGAMLCNLMIQLDEKRRKEVVEKVWDE